MEITSFSEMWPVQLLLFVVGLSIGSFLNVVIYRLPHGLSLALPVV